MKRVLLIGIIIAMGNTIATAQIGKAIAAGTLRGLFYAGKNMQQVQSRNWDYKVAALNNHNVTVATHNPLVGVESLKKGQVVSHPILTPIPMFVTEQEVTYKKEKTSERCGNEYMTMYSLMVTNHSNKDLYVYGSVHIVGDVEREGRHFAGSVPAFSTKCLLTTIDEDFNEVRIKWQDDM